jgi:hypothetical protein
MVAEPRLIWRFSCRNVLERYIGHYNEMFGTNLRPKTVKVFIIITMILLKELTIKKLIYYCSQYVFDRI